jgi:small subunit ribosomal protein S8
MSWSDPIADMLTRIRNALRANKEQVSIRASNICQAIAAVLKKEGYIKDFDRIDDGKQGTLRIALKYDQEGQPVITEITRTSKPGCRIYLRRHGHSNCLDQQRRNERQRMPQRQCRR